MKIKLGELITEYSVRNKENENIPVFSVTNSQGFCKEYFNKDVASSNRTTYKIVPKGCFAYNPSRINVGSVDWQRYEDRVIVSPLYNVFSVSDKVENQYLYHYLKSKPTLRKINATATGSVRNNLKLDMLKDFCIDLPSLEEQQHRTFILTTIESIINRRKNELSILDELIKARFVELFGNGHDGKTPVKMLGSICKFQQGTQIPVEEQFEEQIAGYKRFLRIIDYTQAPQPPRYVNVNGKEVDEKSVVIVRYGATAGFVGRGYQGILANNLFEIIPDETILSKEFLFLALKYGTFEKEVHEKAFGAAMPALSFSMMNDIPVVVPMSEQQSQFISFVEQTDKSKVAIQKSLDLYQELFDKLMNDYFGD